MSSFEFDILNNMKSTKWILFYFVCFSSVQIRDTQSSKDPMSWDPEGANITYLGTRHMVDQMYSLYVIRPHNPSLTLASGCLLFICLVLLALHIHVVRYMIIAGLWKQPFYLQLIVLGFHEHILLVIYGFNLLSSCLMYDFSFPVAFMFVVGGIRMFLETFSVGMMLEIAMTRAYSVFFPLTAVNVLSVPRVLGLVSLVYVYAAVYLGMVNGAWPVYIPRHIVSFPIRSIGESHLGPMGTMLSHFSPIIICCVSYLAASARLALFSWKARIKNQVAPVEATGGGMASRNLSNKGELKNANKRKAQWNMVQLALILFSFYVASTFIRPFIVRSAGDFRVICLVAAAELMIAGLNPVIYLFQCKAIRDVVPLPTLQCKSGNDVTSTTPTRRMAPMAMSMLSRFRASNMETNAATRATVGV